MSELSDEQLLAQHRAGDASAFEHLIRRHHDDLLRFLVRLTGDRAAAEDVFQDAFLQVHISASTFDTTRRFKPWLFTIAANKGRDHLRKKTRRRTLTLSAPVGGSGGDSGVSFIDLMEVDCKAPNDAMDEAERDAQVQEAVDRLPWTLREILLLAYFQKLTYAQIADELGIPLGTVKSRLHASVAAFAKQWKAISEADQADGAARGGQDGSTHDERRHGT